MTFNAHQEWYITCCDTCEIFNHDHIAKGKPSGYLEWLNIDKTSGEAGPQTVKFSAEKYLGGHEGVVYLHCGDEVQNIKIVQGTVAVTEATCKEVTEGPDGKLFRVTGTCKNIYNTEYGNWHLDDGTADITIYGTLDAKGQTKNFLSLGIEEGDVVTVEGPKQLYGTTVELVDVTVINIQKSLVKVDSLTVAGVKKDTIGIEGGEIIAHLTCKGKINVAVPAEAKNWLSILEVSDDIVRFYAAANDGGDRSATIVFKTYSNNKEYTSQTTIYQKGSIQEVSVADFLAAPVSDAQYRITGVIMDVANASYGNCTIRDYSGEVYVYGIGAKGDFGKLGLKVGDIVTLVGQRGAYNDSPQMAKGQYESHKPVTQVTIAEFLTKPDDPNVYYMVSGEITTIDNPAYGNCHIKGVKGDESELYVYGCYPGWGAAGDARKNFMATAGIEVGDLLTVIGPKTTFGTTIELNGGIYFSHQKPNPGR